jgi:hypothetical protein
LDSTIGKWKAFGDSAFVPEAAGFTGIPQRRIRKAFLAPDNFLHPFSRGSAANPSIALKIRACEVDANAVFYGSGNDVFGIAVAGLKSNTGRIGPALTPGGFPTGHAPC